MYRASHDLDRSDYRWQIIVDSGEMRDDSGELIVTVESYMKLGVKKQLRRDNGQLGMENCKKKDCQRYLKL